MSENAEVVRAMIDAFSRRDLEGVLALCDPAAQFEVEEMPEMERFSGLEVAQERGGIVTVRDGLVVRGEFFVNQANTLKAAGLG